jgi:ABC-2 type transport system ATP-binding protein
VIVPKTHRPGVDVPLGSADRGMESGDRLLGRILRQTAALDSESRARAPSARVSSGTTGGDLALEKVIEARGLTKYYDELLAVDHISFDVGQGEIFGFLGPNGAGKTTTIRMLTGLSRPSGGTATVLGFDVNGKMVKAKKHIGVVPEMSNLYDELSALDNLVFVGQLYGIPRDRRRARAEELLRAFGLSERSSSPFATLSRGMKRALTVAAALVHQPQVLFLDEPTVGLDVVAARSLRALIANLKQEGMSIFLTTHYLEEADHLCDRIAILVKGSIVSIDTPANLKAVAEREPVMQVSFRPEGGMRELADELSQQLPGLRVVATDGESARIYGGSSASVLETVLPWAKERGLVLEAVNSVKPSLEDAFIKIAGLSPAVMAAEKGGRK